MKRLVPIIFFVSICAVCFGQKALINASTSTSFYTVMPVDPEAVYFNAESFGMKADGKTDVSDALQKAINQVKIKYNFGIVFIPEGKYLISKTIYVPQAVRIIGYGAKRPEIILAENSPGFQTPDPADKDQILYSRIILYFEEEKPYQKADFNIRKLAESLDSNSTYVSRALNKIGNKKFNQLVNDYRINQVKAEIANNLHQKFTLEHIYTSAGFSQQSTFNRIFKENTGSTPSEYIDNIQQIREK
ncbi:MAG: helix-turn-helix domain-containing protein [Chryseobacterium sp.]|nr:MAG: helix-turn-helix domain-containing protein [Chryseobacterium sp.]